MGDWSQVPPLGRGLVIMGWPELQGPNVQQPLCKCPCLEVLLSLEAPCHHRHHGAGTLWFWTAGAKTRSPRLKCHVLGCPSLATLSGSCSPRGLTRATARIPARDSLDHGSP